MGLFENHFLSAILCFAAWAMLLSGAEHTLAQEAAPPNGDVSASVVDQLVNPSQLDFDTSSARNTADAKPSVKAKGSPEATVVALLQELRQAGNGLPIIDFIDWESAYQSFQDRQVAERERLRITSAENLRAFYEDWYRGSPNVMLRKLGPRLGSMNTKEQRKVLEFFKGLDEQSSKREPPRDPALIESLYEIKKTETKDSNSTVSVVVTQNNKSRIENINLIQKDGLWFLDGVYVIKDPFGGNYR